MHARCALLLGLAGAAGCGRLWFDPVPLVVDDGGPGDDGAGDDAVRELDAGIPATCDGGEVTYVVTTEIDESDGGESPEPPHLGTGLSLREALRLSNMRSGRECIQFGQPMTIMVATELPGIADLAGVEIDGGGMVHLTGIPVLPQLPTGIDLVMGPSAVRGLEVSNFQVGIQARSTGNTIGPGNRTHGCANGVRLDGNSNLIRGLRSHDNTEHGIQIPPLIDGSAVAQVVLYSNTATGIQAHGTTNLVVRHATIALNQIGIDATVDASGLVVENTIFYQQSGAGVAVDMMNDVDTIDFCDFFDDACNNCDIGASSITEDPLFTDVVTSDYRLDIGSPAIDIGTDTGLDVNGDDAGNFNDLAPDLGALESD